MIKLLKLCGIIIINLWISIIGISAGAVMFEKDTIPYHVWGTFSVVASGLIVSAIFYKKI